MPVVKLKKLVAVSSEDKVHVAANLVSPSVGLQWLCCSDNKTKTRIEVVIELAKPSRIKQVEIGNMGSAFVELLVMDSSGHAHKDEEGGVASEGYQSLLPQSMLMSAEESRSGRSLTRTKLFPPDKLSKVALEKKWLYIKIVCLQPFCTNRQFGLRYIRLYSHSPSDEEGTSPVASTPNKAQFIPSPLTRPLSRTPKMTSVLTPTHTTPTSGLLATAKTTPTSNKHPKSENSSKTVPLRRRIACKIGNENDKDDEFSGLESQSRLLKNTLKQDSTMIKDNHILLRVADERAKTTKVASDETPAGFERKKLLVKELPKVESVNFLDSYKNVDDASKNVNRFSSFKMSCLDDSTEFGEEDDNKYYRGRKSRKRPSKKGNRNTDKWISRKSKKDAINVDEFTLKLPSGLRSSPAEKREQRSMDDYKKKQNEVADILCIDENNPDVGIIIDPPPDQHVSQAESGCVTGEDGHVSCPICGQLIPSYFIEVHASECGDSTFGSEPHVDNDVILCG